MRYLDFSFTDVPSEVRMSLTRQIQAIGDYLARDAGPPGEFLPGYTYNGGGLSLTVSFRWIDHAVADRARLLVYKWMDAIAKTYPRDWKVGMVGCYSCGGTAYARLDYIGPWKDKICPV